LEEVVLDSEVDTINLVGIVYNPIVVGIVDCLGHLSSYNPVDVIGRKVEEVVLCLEVDVVCSIGIGSVGYLSEDVRSLVGVRGGSGTNLIVGCVMGVIGVGSMAFQGDGDLMENLVDDIEITVYFVIPLDISLRRFC
jgi:hypothetical protein